MKWLEIFKNSPKYTGIKNHLTQIAIHIIVINMAWLSTKAIVSFINHNDRLYHIKYNNDSINI